MDKPDAGQTKAELDRLVDEFFRAVSFEAGTSPNYEDIRQLFIEEGLLVKNTAPSPEIATVGQFIRPRLASWRAGELTRFREIELREATQVFGNVAHRFSSYAKSGMLNGVAFAARGMISTQFVRTPRGWRISAMAWDDERPGLSIPGDYEPL